MELCTILLEGSNEKGRCRPWGDQPRCPGAERRRRRQIGTSVKPEAEEFLRQFVVGQTLAKRVVSVAVYSHYQRVLEQHQAA